MSYWWENAMWFVFEVGTKERKDKKNKDSKKSHDSILTFSSL